jgi:pyruvate formate lyase activating enzyme
MPREMKMPEHRRFAPEDIVDNALTKGCSSIAYTYTEPTIFFEFSYDTAKLAKDAGIKNIYVTNGFMTREMLEMIQPFLDAANVDIKSFKDETYRTLMGGRLQPVLDSSKNMKEMGIWLEITTLIVPGVNDDPDELEELAAFIVDELGPETPWHLSRFYPQYKMNDRKPTEETLLYKTKDMGESLGLNYVYIGNVFGPSNTYCKECGNELISRIGYNIRMPGLDQKGKCKECQTELAGVGLPD